MWDTLPASGLMASDWWCVERPDGFIHHTKNRSIYINIR